MKTLIKIFSSLLFLCLLACSGPVLDTSSSVKEAPSQMPQLEVKQIFSIDTHGGCMRMGPNCPRYELMSDGSFNVLRAKDSEIANSGSVDMQLVKRWMQLTEKTNFKDLLASLCEGECRGCYDGVDFTYTVFPLSKNLTINSTKYDFSHSEEFFMVSEMLHKAMSKSAPLGVQSR